VQSPIPILVGTSGPRMLRATARWATEWNTWGDPDTVKEKTAAFTDACASVGTDPASIRRSAQALVFFTDSDSARQKVLDRAPAGRSLVGSSAQLVDQLGEYAAQDVDEFALPDFTLGASPEQRRETIQRFREEVAVHLMG
jgi:alkanesulfonate monooxygenase SsuD/methylene tetrahydromethanopterin reductase-like flavin-dependent oxidoreductase (luciferase family)